MHSPLGISDNDQNEKRHYILKIYCGVEQLVARRAHNPKVISSSLVPATIKEGCSKEQPFFVYKGISSSTLVSKGKWSILKILLLSIQTPQ